MTATEMETQSAVQKIRTVPALTVLACAWPALLLASACLLPFLNKSFNIDDPLFLMTGQQVVRHPLHPLDFNLCWNTPAVCVKAYLFSPGASLMGYVLVPTMVSGAHEWTAHFTQLVLCWMAILAMTSLILRFGWDRWHARVGALLLAAIPPFLPMAATAMPDILATALAVVGIERLAAWKAEETWVQGAAAAVALGLAGFARPHLALILPLAAFFLFESLELQEIGRQIRRRAWMWFPVVAGTGLLAAIILATREHNLAIDPPAIVRGWRPVPVNLTGYLVYLAFPLPLALCWALNRLTSKRGRSIKFAFAVAVVGLGVAWFIGMSEPLAWFVAAFGGFALSGLLLEGWRERDPMRLFLMLWVLIPFPIVIYAHLPIKYLLPCMPAIILLCLKLLDEVPMRVCRAAIVALIVSGTAYSLLILRSDAEFAEYGRDALHSMITPHVAAGETVWYPGQYWSYWYAPLDGARLTYKSGPQPKPGDLLVVDVFAEGEDAPLDRFPHRRLVETISHEYRFGRTMGAGFGLYSNWYGYWLWGFGKDKQDRFELWRITGGETK